MTATWDVAMLLRVALAVGVWLWWALGSLALIVIGRERRGGSGGWAVAVAVIPLVGAMTFFVVRGLELAAEDARSVEQRRDGVGGGRWLPGDMAARSGEEQLTTVTIGRWPRREPRQEMVDERCRRCDTTEACRRVPAAGIGWVSDRRG